MKSIKKRLLISLLAIMGIGTCTLAGTTYLELKSEMDELFDENIKQIAHIIAANDLDLSTQSAFKTTPSMARKILKSEEEFLIQIWHDDILFYSSFPSIDLPHQGAGGVKTIIFDHQKWRYYGITQNNWLIQVSQPTPIRHSVIQEVYIEILTPILIQIPLMAGLIWFFIGYGFKPLERISSSIEQRSSIFLDRLPEHDAPSEILSFIRALNGLLNRLSQAMETQRQFTTDAAHELRTPLTAVRLELDVLKRAKTASERNRSIDGLFNAVDRCTRLAQQLLELARQDPDILHENTERVALKPIIRSLINEVTPLSQKKSIAINSDKVDDVSLLGQPYAITALISNLINNAVLYTPQNGQIEIEACAQKDVIIFSVSDNGIGIPDTEKLRIFDRFYRLSNTDGTGSGLGLSIVKAVADHHNAHIDVQDGINGTGSCFKIKFPV